MIVQMNPMAIKTYRNIHSVLTAVVTGIFFISTQ
jgi:hypothetical protein